MPMSKKRVTQKVSSVTESYSSMTSVKIVSHKRSSSGKLTETWSSPSLMLTSPQTWVSGSQIVFPSPTKSPSPKRRITRRSSVYVKPLWSGKSQVKSPLKELEFKVPASLTADSVSKKTRLSSVHQKGSPKLASSKRSSIYRRTEKGASSSSILIEEEVSKFVSSQSKISESKKSRASLRDTVKGAQSPSTTTRSRKRNASEIDKKKSPGKLLAKRKRNAHELDNEQSPEKPLAKRRKQQADKDSLKVSAKRDQKRSSKSSVKRSKASSEKTSSSPSPSQTSKKVSEKGKTVAAQRVASKSPSPRKTRAGKSLQAQNRSPVFSRKSTPTKQGEKEKKVENIINDDVNVDLSFSKKQTRKRTARDDVSTGTPKQKLAKSSEKNSSKTRLSSSVSKAKLRSSKTLLSKNFSDSVSSSKTDLIESETSGKQAVNTPSTPKSSLKLKGQVLKQSSSNSNKKSLKKRGQVRTSSYDTPVLNISTGSNTTPKRKLTKSSEKNRSKPRLSGSISRAKLRSSKTSLSKEKFFDSASSSKTDLIESGTPGKQTVSTPSTPKSSLKSKGQMLKKSSSSSKKSIKKHGQVQKSSHDTPILNKSTGSSKTTKRKLQKRKESGTTAEKTPSTPKSVSKSVEVLKLSSASSKKTSVKRREQVRKSAHDNSVINISVELNTTPGKKLQTPKTEMISTSTLTAKKSVIAKKEGKQISAETPTRGHSSNRVHKGKASTPKSRQELKRRSQKSSVDNFGSARSIEKSVRNSTAKISDSLDGSFLLVSEKQSEKNSSRLPSPTKKRKSMTRQSGRSVEDEKAVSSTPKMEKTSKSESAAHLKISAKQNHQKTATPRSHKNAKSVTALKRATLSEKSYRSSETKKASARRTSSILLTDTSDPASASKNGTSRKHILTPVKHSGKSLTSANISSIFSRDVDLSESSLAQSSYNTLSLSRQAQNQLSRSSLISQGEKYQEEKTFSQYIERSSGRGLERYGRQAIERTVGGQTYQAGGYLIQQSKGPLGEREQEEEEWEEEDVNNSALSLSEDANTTVSTSVYSNRCIIL